MTINVAVKCPDGIVMCADSLVTISSGGPPIAIIPYYDKLFPIGAYAAGAMLNGAGSIGPRTIEDIVFEFGQTSGAPLNNYALQNLATDLLNFVQGVIGAGPNPLLEIIVAGYSMGTSAGVRRFGEIYSLGWDNSPGTITPLYNIDTEFGTHYGGQPQTLDRFRYGTDNWVLRDMVQRRQLLFDQTVNYLRTQPGVTIPAGIATPGLDNFNVFSLVSDFVFNPVANQTFQDVKDLMLQRFETMERFFSLQVAVDYCTFLASCSYAVNNFTSMIPGVGSEMRVATVTKEEGFSFKKIWTVKPSDVRIP